jgi:uncharacterized membrane protein
MKSVYSAVRTEFLNKAVCASPLKGLTIGLHKMVTTPKAYETPLDQDKQSCMMMMLMMMMMMMMIIIIIIIIIIPVIIGATGTISKSFRKYVSNIPGIHEVRELQKTAILGTAHTLRKVLT